MPHIDVCTDSGAERTGQSDDGLTQVNRSNDEAVRLGQVAWGRIRGDHSWNDWLLIGAAHCVIRTEAMREAFTNEPRGRNYNAVFSALLKRYGFDLDKGVRARLFEVMANLPEIEKWRSTLTTTERIAYNHPNCVVRRWKKSTIVPDPNVAPNKVSAYAKLKTEYVAALKNLHHAEERLRYADGGDLWSLNDDARDIALAIAAKLRSPVHTERVAHALLKIAKEKKADLAKVKSAQGAEART
jgi:hypothetical protein